MKAKMISLALTLVCLCAYSSAIACSAFTLKNKSQVLMCKSYDWNFGEGILMFNPRGIEKTSMPVAGDHKRISWTTKYANLSFNQYGQTMANGGINEKGLAIEVLWLRNSKYEAVNGGEAINELQWIQYGLDNYATVEELIEKSERFKIKPLYAAVHYYISDASGNSAVIEYIDGKRTISTGKNMPYSAITNSTYTYSIDGFQNKGEGCHRFNKICTSITNLPESLSAEDALDYGLASLDKVKSEERTQWQIVYDLKKQTVKFRTKGNTSIKTIDLHSFDPNGRKTLYIDLNSPASVNHTNFKKVRYRTNNWLWKNAFEKLEIPVPFLARRIVVKHVTKGKTTKNMYKIVNAMDRLRK
jgi:choloylglycine hydrolase